MMVFMTSIEAGNGDLGHQWGWKNWILMMLDLLMPTPMVLMTLVESRTPTDTDSDTTIDMFDLDSDNDGCNDVKEAGYTDGDDDGLLGDSPVTQTSFRNGNWNC